MAGKPWYEATLKMKFRAGNCIWRIGGMMVNYLPGESDSVPDSAVEFAEQMILYTRLAFKRSLLICYWEHSLLEYLHLLLLLEVETS